MAKSNGGKCICETQGVCGHCGETIHLFPNLDDCDDAERNEVMVALSGLQLYITYKKMAEEYREKGRIKDATRVEKGIEEIYKRMPRWAKW